MEADDDETFELETPEALARRLDELEGSFVVPVSEADRPAVSGRAIFERPKLDPATSLRLLRDSAALARYFDEHEQEYGNVRSLIRAIDDTGAWALEEQLVDDQRRTRDAALAELRAAQKHPGKRNDATVLKHMFGLKGARLPDRLRQVYALCVEQGLSLNECARRLGIGRETVRSHLRRLRAEVPAAWREAKTA